MARWDELPLELRLHVLQYVVADARVRLVPHHPSTRSTHRRVARATTPPVSNYLTVAKTFVAPAEIGHALLTSAEIVVGHTRDVQALYDRLGHGVHLVRSLVVEVHTVTRRGRPSEMVVDPRPPKTRAWWTSLRRFTMDFRPALTMQHQLPDLHTAVMVMRGHRFRVADFGRGVDEAPRDYHVEQTLVDFLRACTQSILDRLVRSDEFVASADHINGFLRVARHQQLEVVFEWPVFFTLFRQCRRPDDDAIASFSVKTLLLTLVSVSGKYPVAQSHQRLSPAGIAICPSLAVANDVLEKYRHVCQDGGVPRE